MGVHGFIPFLRKSCPEAIRLLPDRFKELAGKRIVIDGTLITQRLHFAPIPHPHRHVLGWYRICEELNENQISAICVFDGTRRHVAKTRELLRRKADYKQTMNRGQIESERLKRLQFVNNFLVDLPNVPQGQGSEVAKALNTLRISEDRGFQKAYDALSSQASPNALQQVSQLEQDIQPPPSPPASEDKLEAHILLASLKAIFDSFQSSVTYLADRLKVEEPSPPAQQPSPPAEGKGDQDLVLTKAQSQLSVMERDLWSKISSLSVATMHQDQEQYKDLLNLSSEILDQSSKMSVSFQRRTNLPTPETYNESKDILKAMGILCIEAPAATEGEALASSIALHGDADFVVSEDTDVLVYGAPMLRNITSSHEPLEIVYADEIQRSLELDHTSYLDFILLLGTDFSQRIKNVGPQRALQFIRQHGSIENVIRSETHYPPRIPTQDYLEEVNMARDLFRKLPRSPDIKSMEQASKDDAAITEVLTRYKLGRHLMKSPHWTYEDALGGNYFHDNPIAP